MTDTAKFGDTGRSETVVLDGEISAAAIDMEGGNYSFTGNGFLSSGRLSVLNGAALTLENNRANTYAEGTSIDGRSTLTIRRADALGSGTIENEGTLNIVLPGNRMDASTAFANKLIGTGIVSITGGKPVILTADSTATGILYTANNLFFGDGGNSGSYAGDICLTEDDVWITVDRSGTWNYGGTLSVLEGKNNGALIVGNAAARFAMSGTSRLSATYVDAGTLELKNGAKIFDSDIWVNDGATLELTAARQPGNAAVQGGSFWVEDGGTLLIHSAAYELGVNEGTAAFYLAKDIDINQWNVGTPLVANRLFEIDRHGVQATNDGLLLFNLHRVSAADAFPKLSSGIAATLDNIRGGNKYINSVLETLSPEALLQSGFDFLNLSGAVSATYEAKGAINRSMDARALDGHDVMPRYGYRGQCAPAYGHGAPYGGCLHYPGRTELWGAFLYDNAQGFGLYSGNFRYGYTNDLYGLTFGLDKTNGGERIGIMGVAGWNNIRSYGEIAGTKNDAAFGGVYGYLNERFGDGNLFMHVGWLGMNNEIAQDNNDNRLGGRLNNGLFSIAATFSQVFCFGGLHVTPSVGIEYGHYYQKRMDVAWGTELAFKNFTADANLLMIPIGVRFSRDMSMYNGILRPEVRLRYIANVSDIAVGYNTWTLGSNTPAPMIATISDRRAGDVGAGISWMEGITTISASYGFLFSEYRQNHFVSLTGLWKF